MLPETTAASRGDRLRVSPSTSTWSSATFVRTTTGASRTLVASSRPPTRLHDGDVDAARRELREAAAVSTSNCVAPAPCGRTRASAVAGRAPSS
jgi:hypothetical protein